jgi:CcmD family protein
MKRITVFLLLMFAVMNSFAQTSPEMADVMRTNGKIYVVVAVCLVIMFGLIGYVFLIDRKISKLEAQKKD